MSEYLVHKSICNYIKLQYPDVIFTSDASGIRLTIGNAKKMLALKANCKIPDLLILEPNSKFHGLILEIKKDDAKIFLKNGELSGSNHIQEQLKTLIKLRAKGYQANFAVGFNDAKEQIDKYMNQ